MKYTKTFFAFIGIWFIASVLNGLLSGICITINSPNFYTAGAGTVVFALIFSFICSAPLVGMVWLITTIAQFNGRKGHALFQLTLGTAMAGAIAGAVFFINTFGKEFKEVRYIVALCIIVSALSAVLFFRNQLKTYE
jgi:hypothetical protein